MIQRCIVCFGIFYVQNEVELDELQKARCWQASGLGDLCYFHALESAEEILQKLGD